MEVNKIYNVDALTGLKMLPDNSVDCVVTSPPYWGLRWYGDAAITIWDGDADCKHEWLDFLKKGISGGENSDVRKKKGQENFQIVPDNIQAFCVKCGAWRGQLGQEPTPELYVEHLVEIFREVKRVLKPEGTLWLNLGDSYWSNRSKLCETGGVGKTAKCGREHQGRAGFGRHHVIKPKDLIGIPWMVAFALRNDGWWLRQDIIWCLSGGTYVYVRSAKGDMPMTIKDLARLRSDTVKLWNGYKWTRVKGMWPSKRSGNEIEIELRSGERISCTPEHLWPTKNGLKKASELKVGDVLLSCQLPEPENPSTPEYIPDEVGWFLGLYLAEGSRDSHQRIQIASHAEEVPLRLKRLSSILEKYGATYSVFYDDGNGATINISSKVLNAIIDTYLYGSNAENKCLTTTCWQRSNKFLENLLQGYLDGDGHWDDKNKRWRIGFTRNYSLERDLRVLCARLGYSLTLKLDEATCNGKKHKIFRGEIRIERSGHHNEKDRNEIVNIRKSCARQFWDIEVEDEPNLFALASGVLTHNSKPNAMPESVKDRCTRSHEYIFLLAKSAKYYYDYEAIKEKASGKKSGNKRPQKGVGMKGMEIRNGLFVAQQKTWHTRNKRSVWTITTKPFKGAHFAVFPPELAEISIKAGCPEGGIVLDPFMGSGTVAVVAQKLGRNYIGFEINPDYVKMAEERILNNQNIKRSVI